MKKILTLITLFAGTVGCWAQTLTVHCNDKGKYGYVDENGKEVVKCQYDLTEEFKDGFGKVTKGDKIGYVNAAGKVVVQPKYSVTAYSGNKFWLLDGKNTLLILDNEGKQIVQLKNVYNLVPTTGNQRQFAYINTSKNQLIYDLETGKKSVEFSEVLYLSKDYGKEIYIVKRGQNYELLNGDYKNPLPFNLSLTDSETLRNIYLFWTMLESPDFNYEEFIANENYQKVLNALIDLMSATGVTADFKTTLPSFVWSINNIKHEN